MLWESGLSVNAPLGLAPDPTSGSRANNGQYGAQAGVGVLLSGVFGLKIVVVFFYRTIYLLEFKKIFFFVL